MLQILYRAMQIHFLYRNSQTVIPKVLPQEETKHGKYQPKQLKSVKIMKSCLQEFKGEEFQAVLVEVKILYAT